MTDIKPLTHAELTARTVARVDSPNERERSRLFATIAEQSAQIQVLQDQVTELLARRCGDADLAVKVAAFERRVVAIELRTAESLDRNETAFRNAIAGAHEIKVTHRIDNDGAFVDRVFDRTHMLRRR